MQIKIFTIPVIGGDQQNEELNLFLRQNKVADVKKEFFGYDNSYFWSFCISYLPDVKMKQEPTDSNRQKEKTDYKNILSPECFYRFSEMRKFRRDIAMSEAIPPYAVFTDAELAEIAKLEEPTMSNLGNIFGIGKRKIEKYGESFCSFLSGINTQDNA